jgi:hypothetical protein
MTMKRLVGNKWIEIPDNEVEKIAVGLGISMAEAAQVWLEDAEIEINEEQTELNKTASKVKIDRGVAQEKHTATKPRTVKVSDEKKELFDTILRNLDRCWGVSRENIKVLNENKLIEVSFNDKTFKIDIIECRKSKK